MDISYLLKYLWHKKWWIIVPTVIAISLAWFLTRKMSPTFTSTAELSTGYMDGDFLDDPRKLNKNVLFNNVIQTLQSYQILDQVSYKLLLHDLQQTAPFKRIEGKAIQQQIISDFPGAESGLLNALSNRVDSFYVLNLAVKEDRTIRRLADLYQYSPDAILSKIHLQRIEGSDFIRLTATTLNPRLSAFLANAICQEFLTLYQSRKGVASDVSLDTLKKLVETKKRILDSKLQLLAGGNEAVLTNSEGLLGALRTQLNRQNENLIAAKVALEHVDEQLNQNKGEGGIATNEDIIALRRSIDQLYGRYVNGDSKDKDLLLQIEALRTRLQHRLSAAGGNPGASIGELQQKKVDLQVKISVAVQTMNDLKSKINALEGTVRSSAAQQGIVQSIQSEIEVARQQYMEANKMYSAALNHTLFPGNDFRQVLRASPPLYPNPSKKIQIIIFSGIGVLFFSIFLLLFFEFVDSSIKTPSYLSKQIQVPLLASLKRMDMGSLPVEQIFSVNGSLPSHKRQYREEIKQLRYEIEHSGKSIFLITGFHSDSGKTTVLEALAGSLCLNKQKVLLVDVNFKNNTLSVKYHATASLEELDLPAEFTSAKKLIRENVVKAGEENISLIGCGQRDNTPSEILPLNNILKWLKENEHPYDYVFVDCAALCKGPDGKELLKYVESVILVYSADQSMTEGDRKLEVFLRHERFHVVGAVLNKVNPYCFDF